MQHAIRYKTKIKDGQVTPLRAPTRKHYFVDGRLARPNDHSLYNSDLMPGLLKRAVAKAMPWTIDTDNLPSHITVTTEGFMSIVVINITGQPRFSE